MNRRIWIWSAMALLGATALVSAAESLRIIPMVHEKQVLVSFEMADAYNDDVREAISSGLKTTYTYDVELRMIVPAWVDRTIMTTVVTTSDQYDNLTRRHRLARTIDGRVEEATVSEDDGAVRRWLTTLTRMPLCDTSKLEANHDYYVRINARVRPRRASFIGWTYATTGMAKFTFIP